MNGEIVYAANEWVLGLVFLVLMVTACEAGFRLGCRPGQQKASENTKSQVATVEAGILGVLGLLIGFTMSMAVTRFEVRKQLVLEEAKAIGTAYLRTQLLPAAEGTEIADLLRAYTDALFGMRVIMAGAAVLRMIRTALDRDLEGGIAVHQACSGIRVLQH